MQIKIDLYLTKDELLYLDKTVDEIEVSRSEYVRNLIRQFSGNDDEFLSSNANYFQYLSDIKLNRILEILNSSLEYSDYKPGRNKTDKKFRISIRVSDEQFYKLKSFQVETGITSNTIIRKLIQIKMLGMEKFSEQRQVLDKLNMIIFHLELINGMDDIKDQTSKYYREKNKGFNN